MCFELNVTVTWHERPRSYSLFFLCFMLCFAMIHKKAGVMMMISNNLHRRMSQRGKELNRFLTFLRDIFAVFLVAKRKFLNIRGFDQKSKLVLHNLPVQYEQQYFSLCCSSMRRRRCHLWRRRKSLNSNLYILSLNFINFSKRSLREVWLRQWRNSASRLLCEFYRHRICFDAQFPPSQDAKNSNKDKSYTKKYKNFHRWMFRYLSLNNRRWHTRQQCRKEHLSSRFARAFHKRSMSKTTKLNDSELSNKRD